MLLRKVDAPEQRTLFHKATLFDAALSAAFPFGFTDRARRFADRKRELETELYPMLRADEAKPALETLMESAAEFVEDWVMPQDESEAEFLDRFANGDFEPTLLFGEGDMAARAMMSPEAGWKLANIGKMEE